MRSARRFKQLMLGLVISSHIMVSSSGSSIYRRYSAPLPSEFMPLCGNGRVDSVADYLAYFDSAQHTRRLMVTFPDNINNINNNNNNNNNNNAAVEVQLAMDEICDDGNRLDGDGCSADCLNLDAFVSPCDVALPLAGQAIEDFVFPANMTSAAHAVVAAADGIYEITSDADNGRLATRLLAAKSFEIHAMWLTAELWVYGQGAVYSVAAAGLLEMRFTVPVAASSHEKGYFFEELGRLYLVCKDGGHIWLWDVAAETVVASATGNTPPVISYLRSAVAGGFLIMMQDDVLASVFVGGLFGTPPRVILVPPQAADPTVARVVFSPLLSMDSTLVNTHITYVPPVSAPPQLGGFRARAVSAVLAAENMVGPRWLLDPAQGPDAGVLMIGSDSAARVAFQNNNNNNNSNNNNNNNNSDSLDSLLDTRLGYNVFNQALYDNVTDQRTYRDVLPTNHSPLPAFVVEQLRSKLVSRVMENPMSRSLWAIQNGVLKELSRRGVSMELRRGDGRCVPTCLGLCPSCQWSPNCSQCVPCPYASSTVEWRLQCAPCMASMGLGRRRLFTQETGSSIVFSVAGCTAAEASAAFAPCSSTTSAAVVEVTVAANGDPQAALRGVSAKLRLLAPPWQVITQPRLLFYRDDSVPSSAGALWPPLFHWGLLAVGFSVYLFI